MFTVIFHLRNVLSKKFLCSVLLIQREERVSGRNDEIGSSGSTKISASVKSFNSFPILFIRNTRSALKVFVGDFKRPISPLSPSSKVVEKKPNWSFFTALRNVFCSVDQITEPYLNKT